MKPCTFRPEPSKFFLKKTRSEKISYTLSKESFSYTFENGTLHFSPLARKIKEFHPGKISYASGNGNPEKISYIFSKESFSYISGKRNHEKRNLQNLKIRKILYFLL